MFFSFEAIFVLGRVQCRGVELSARVYNVDQDKESELMKVSVICNKRVVVNNRTYTAKIEFNFL